MKHSVKEELPALIAAKIMAYKDIYVPKDLRGKIKISINQKTGVITIKNKNKK